MWRAPRALLVVAIAAVALVDVQPESARAQPAAPAPAPAGCPAEMARVEGFCVDRWEASLVDSRSGRALSPHYPAQPKLFTRVREVWQVEREMLGDAGARKMPLPDPPAWQLAADFEPKAVSRPSVMPHGYLSYHVAHRACKNAGKRLCSEAEWTTACRGERRTKFPYGAHFALGRCNVHRSIHPAAVLHGSASIGLTDPRLNLVVEDGRDPVLHLTGTTVGCVSAWGSDSIYDMVGNLDEWIEDPTGVFVGGFYARRTTKGCEAKIASHAATYYDYSTGTRCCADPR